MITKPVFNFLNNNKFSMKNYFTPISGFDHIMLKKLNFPPKLIILCLVILHWLFTFLQYFHTRL